MPFTTYEKRLLSVSELNGQHDIYVLDNGTRAGGMLTAVLVYVLLMNRISDRMAVLSSRNELCAQKLAQKSRC